jgi:hypothetical protein
MQKLINVAPREVNTNKREFDLIFRLTILKKPISNWQSEIKVAKNLLNNHNPIR